MKIIFFDCETTGLSHFKHGIHQLSGMVVINGEVKEEFNIKMQPIPRAEFDKTALLVSGVTREQIESYQTSLSGYRQFIAILDKYVLKFNKTDKFFLAGFNNASFDNQFIREWFLSCGDKYFGSWFWPNPLDVYILSSQYLIDKRAHMQDFKLRTVAAHLGIQVDDSKLHDAMYDIRITKLIYDIVTAKPSAVIAQYDQDTNATIVTNY